MKSDLENDLEEIGPLHLSIESTGKPSREEAFKIMSELNKQGYVLTCVIPLDSGKALYVGILDRSTFARVHDDKRPWSRKNSK